MKFDDSANKFSKIKIIGIGGAGNNAINTMIKKKLSGVKFIAVNTDAQALNSSLADIKLQIGKKLVKGFGAGGEPEIGRLSAEESEEDIKKSLDNTDVIFITAGMGGGTGTGASSIIAKIAKENQILTIAIVTYPFIFEGKIRAENADKGIGELKNIVNALVVIQNEKIKEQFTNLELYEAFQRTDFVLYNAAKTLSDIINKNGYINVDLSDVRTVMSQMGYALIGLGFGEGENRAETAVQEAISNPLIKNISLSNSKAILVNVTVGYDFKTIEFDKILSVIHSQANENTNIIEGLVFEKEMKNNMNIAIIATGLPEDDISTQPIEHTIKEKSIEDEKSEIQLILKRIRECEKLSPAEKYEINKMPIITNTQDIN
ncbi:MAG: cell division protein FtsZ [Candidatus Cloacimonetes bacterium]|nr:cell division protein FtsZ [Candidatus Cloacimonadota bacterium]MBL7086285.1 cell division protein FtsZ [Candidatus Cloacimonadota bacterium]